MSTYWTCQLDIAVDSVDEAHRIFDALFALAEPHVIGGACQPIPDDEDGPE